MEQVDYETVFGGSEREVLQHPLVILERDLQVEDVGNNLSGRVEELQCRLDDLFGQGDELEHGNAGATEPLKVLQRIHQLLLVEEVVC